MGDFELCETKLSKGWLYFETSLCINMHSFGPVAEQEAQLQVDAAVSDASKMLKRISFPEMDDDALASTYIMKVLGCISKWQAKASSLSAELDPEHTSTKRPLACLLASSI